MLSILTVAVVVVVVVGGYVLQYDFFPLHSIRSFTIPIPIILRARCIRPQTHSHTSSTIKSIALLFVFFARFVGTWQSLRQMLYDVYSFPMHAEFVMCLCMNCTLCVHTLKISCASMTFAILAECLNMIPFPLCIEYNTNPTRN